MQDIDWDDLRYVLALARCGSHAAGARLLGVNETTLARRIAQLEARLGSKLFQRSGPALSLTELGEQAVNRAERIESEVAAISVAANATTSEVAGSVRVTSIPMLLNRLLLPELLNFTKPIRGCGLNLLASQEI
jgi:DNA-binding transcriptional LysR family regulator